MKKIILIAIVLVFIIQNVNAEIIPSDRKISWYNVGVEGGIPYRTTVCATLSPSGGNDAPAIQSAIDSCPTGQVVMLNTGTFRISSGIRVKSGITLRGAGIGATVIKNTAGGFSLVSFYNNPDWRFEQAPSRDITGGNTKDSTTITTSGAHGWNIGDVILIDQLEDPSGDPPISSTGHEDTCTWCSRNNGIRPAGQLVKVVSVPNANTAVLEFPLNKNYDKSPQGIKLVSVTSNAGVEDMTLDSSDYCANGNTGIFSSMFSENSWLLRVELKRICRIGLAMEVTYRNTVKECIIHETEHHTSNGGYMFWMKTAGSANLIEDNIFYNGLTGFVYNGALSGNVFAYNYITKMWNTQYPGSAWPGIAAHGAHPMMNLFEGNYLDGSVIWHDFIHGTSALTTYLRNRQITDTSPQTPTNTLYGIQLFKNSYYINIVGNVLGRAGYEDVYQSYSRYDGRQGIYYFEESIVEDKLLRHGNWDYYNNGVVWDPSIADYNIPNSYYLTSRPSWWCDNIPWPPIGPDVSGYSNTIPAKLRYEGGSCGSITPQCTTANDCADQNCRTKSCDGGQCVYTAITPVCPSASNVNCGVQITPTNNCGSCSGTGTRCSTGTCVNGQCLTPQQECSDGTLYGQCSSTRPRYCDNGNLVDRCSVCGCASGQCQNDGSCKSQLEGDLDNDGDVDIFDLIIIAVNFGKSDFDPRADTNNDNVIDIFDIVYVASRFS